MSIRRTHVLALSAVAAATLIALTAVPGLAAKQATKIYTLHVTPSQAASGQSTDFFVKMTNVTPGNSNPNSFSVTAPSGFVVSAATISAGTNANASASVTVVGSSTVNVQNLDPVKTNQFVTVKVTATTPATSSCGSVGGYTWTATVWTGSALSGDTFALNNAGSAQQTTLVGSCGLRFVVSPVDGTVGTDQSVQVEVLSGGSRATWFQGPITIELVSGPAGASLSGNGPLNAVGGLATFSQFQGDTPGGYSVKATSPGVQDSAPASFTLYAGVLDCGQAVTIGEEGAQVTLTRLEGTEDGTNPDGSACTKIPYTLTRDENVVEFLKDLDLQPAAEFTVEVNAWDPEPAANPVPPSQVEPPSPAHDVLWCGGTATAPEMPTGEAWCLISQSTQIVGDGMMQVTETLYLKGDARVFR